jgi:disulfide bond formation protein DsbB
MGVFQGLTQCSTTGGGGSAAEMLKDILQAPLVRCDQVQWSFLGISMAGWNAIVSIGSAMVILWLSLKRPMARAA